MAHYCFHCTDGRERVSDTAGKDIREPMSLKQVADETAQKVMHSFYDHQDWAGWHVSVHDLQGRRELIIPFVADGRVLAHAA